MKDRDFVVIGTAPNFNDLYKGEKFSYWLNILKDNYTVVGMNQIIWEDDIRPNCDYFITIDYYTWSYLADYPEYYDKMYVDKTLDTYVKKKNIPLHLKNVFSVDKDIHLEDNKLLYLDKRHPTCLQTALNLCLVKNIDKNNKPNIYLWGVELTSNWNHCRKDIEDCKKDITHINNMRESVYKFKNYCNLYTLNNNTSLNIQKQDLVKLM